MADRSFASGSVSASSTGSRWSPTGMSGALPRIPDSRAECRFLCSKAMLASLEKLRRAAGGTGVMHRERDQERSGDLQPLASGVREAVRLYHLNRGRDHELAPAEQLGPGCFLHRLS